jgi:hypothetical protein
MSEIIDKKSFRQFSGIILKLWRSTDILTEIRKWFRSRRVKFSACFNFQNSFWDSEGFGPRVFKV